MNPTVGGYLYAIRYSQRRGPERAADCKIGNPRYYLPGRTAVGIRRQTDTHRRYSETAEESAG